MLTLPVEGGRVLGAVRLSSGAASLGLHQHLHGPMSLVL